MNHLLLFTGMPMTTHYNNKPLICPVCSSINPPGSELCHRCGTSIKLDVTTVDVGDQLKTSGMTQHLPPTHQQGMLNEGVVLYIAGEIRPLIIRGKTEITMGRQIDGLPLNVIDMTPYHGHLLGVSRRHASIRINEDGQFIEDHGSTNGTWLNEKRLASDRNYVVNSGDQIRLGQLIMFVYFASRSTRQQLELKLTETSMVQLDTAAFTASYLATQASPYLDAIIGIQKVIDKVLERKQETSPSVTSMNVNAEKRLVDVTIVDVMDAVQLVQDMVIPWRHQHRSIITDLRGLDKLVKEGDKEARPSTKVLHHLDDLAHALVVELLPNVNLVSEQRPDVMKLLMPHLRVILSSTIEVTKSYVS